MTNTTSVSLRRTLQLSSTCALIALAGMSGITGCSKSDDAQAAVQQAGRSFSSIAAGDSTDAQTFSAKTYKETEALVAPFAGSEDGYAEAAAVALSLSKLGQAALASQQAARAETQALQKARIVRGMLNEWMTMTAIAQGASQFDGSAERADIEKLITMRQDDIEQYTKQRNIIDSQIGDLDAQIAGLRAKSNTERNLAGGLELEMPRVSAQQAAEIVVRVREHTLRADGYELEAIRIEGVVGQLRPGAREISLNVDKAASQVELLIEARDELHQREVASRSDAKQANDAAAAAAKRIDQAVNEYADFRDSDVISANEKAISLGRSASSALRDANRATKQIASLTKASVQQTLAECYSRQATGYAESAILFNALDEAGLSGNWGSQAQTALGFEIEAQDAANEAFQGAASALRGARIRGDEGEKLEATAVRLDRLGGVEPEPEFEDSFEDSGDEYDDFTDEDMDADPIEEDPIEDDD